MNYLSKLVTAILTVMLLAMVPVGSIFCADEPVVESVGFVGAPAGGDTALTLTAVVSAAQGRSVSGISFYVAGASAQDLLKEGGLSYLPDSGLALAEAVDKVLAVSKEFVLIENAAGVANGAGGFNLNVNIAVGLPADAVFLVKTIAIDSQNASSVERLDILTIDKILPANPALNLSLLTSSGNKYFSFNAQCSSADNISAVVFSLLGSSAKNIVDVNGILEDADTFVLAKDIAVTAAQLGQITFAGSLMAAPEVNVPADGAVILLARALDSSGNISSSSKVFYTADIQQTADIQSIEVIPSEITLRGFGETAQLQVFGVLSDGTKIDLTGSASATEYLSNTESVATVTSAGLITGLANGQAVVTVKNRGYTQDIKVTVDQSAVLESLELSVKGQEVGPAGLIIPRVGNKAQLKVIGTFSGGGKYDLSLARFGTEYYCAGSAVIEISPDGEAKSVAVGKAVIRAINGDLEARLDVEVQDGPPSINLSAPKIIVAEGEDVLVTANVEDDLGLRGVEKAQFFLNGNPILTDDTYPYEFALRAPEGMAGKSLKIFGRAWDIAGHEVDSSELVIEITGPADKTPPRITVLAPESGANVVEGVTLLFRITTGVGGEIIERAEFYADGSLVATSTVPRFIFRDTGEKDQNGQPIKETLPAWDGYYLPPKGMAGRSMAVQAKAYDKAGNLTATDNTIIRIIADMPPSIVVNTPLNNAEVTEEQDLAINFTVFDGLNIYGEDVEVLVNDKVVFTDTSRGRQNPEGFLSNFITNGSSNFVYKYNIPKGSRGRKFKIRATALDSAGHKVSSDTFTVTAVANQPPQVQVSSPLPGSEITAGDTIKVAAKAVDDVQVKQVEFFMSFAGTANQKQSLGVDVEAPYEMSFEVPVEDAGSNISFYAQATDNTAFASLSDPSTVSVVPDKVLPTAAISQPKDSAQIADTQNVLISVGGFDDIKVSKVEVLVNNELRFVKENPVVVDDKM